MYYFGTISAICQCKEDFIEFDGMEGCIQINTFGPCAEGEQVVRGENGGECKVYNNTSFSSFKNIIVQFLSDLRLLSWKS